MISFSVIKKLERKNITLLLLASTLQGGSGITADVKFVQEHLFTNQ